MQAELSAWKVIPGQQHLKYYLDRDYKRKGHKMGIFPHALHHYTCTRLTSYWFLKRKYQPEVTVFSHLRNWRQTLSTINITPQLHCTLSGCPVQMASAVGVLLGRNSKQKILGHPLAMRLLLTSYLLILDLIISGLRIYSLIRPWDWKLSYCVYLFALIMNTIILQKLTWVMWHEASLNLKQISCSRFTWILAFGLICINLKHKSWRVRGEERTTCSEANQTWKSKRITICCTKSLVGT